MRNRFSFGKRQRQRSPVVRAKEETKSENVWTFMNYGWQYCNKARCYNITVVSNEYKINLYVYVEITRCWMQVSC